MVRCLAAVDMLHIVRNLLEPSTTSTSFPLPKGELLGVRCRGVKLLSASAVGVFILLWTKGLLLKEVEEEVFHPAERAAAECERMPDVGRITADVAPVVM